MKGGLLNWIRARRSANWSLRFVFTVMYVGAIGAITYISGLVECGNYFFVTGSTAYALILGAMLGLELLESRHYRYAEPRRTAVLLLLARMALIETAVTVDCGQISTMLYPIIPFIAYFSFGAAISNLLSLLYVFVVMIRFWPGSEAVANDSQFLVLFFVFIIMLIFLQLLARVFQRDDQSRRQTEKLLADLEISHRRLQIYARKVADLATMEERNRLARDIHDSLGHFLTAVNIQLEKALAFRERDPQVAEQAIRDAKQAAGEALQDVRRSVSALRASDDPFSFVSAVKGLLRGLDDDQLVVEFTVTGNEQEYNGAILMALYRVVQEGLTNVQKHAGAGQVNLAVDFGPRLVSLQLFDDGRGFDIVEMERSGTADSGFGLQGVQERLELVQGTLNLASSEEGTTLQVMVPKEM